MKKVLVRRKGLENNDYLDTVSTPPNTILGFGDNAETVALTGRDIGQILVTDSVDTVETWPLLPAASVAAGTSALFTATGTGSEAISRAATGGVNLKSQPTTPADGDNVLLAPVATTGMIVPITFASLMVFNTKVALNTITKLFVSVGLSELFTDVDPTGTAGEGALFLFDPTIEVTTGLDAAAHANWILASKVNGVDTFTATSVPVVAAQNYALKIAVDVDLKANFYIDGILVGQGPALTNGDSIGAFVGLELTATPGGQKDMDVRYVRLDRAIG